MRADGVLAMLDRWGRLLLPGTILLFGSGLAALLLFMRGRKLRA